MNDFSSETPFEVPPSFVALFVPPGRIKPLASRAHISERYEFCEDLANMLTDPAATQQWQLGIDSSDVLARVQTGLLTEPAQVTEPEAWWVAQRLAELLGWDALDQTQPLPSV